MIDNLDLKKIDQMRQDQMQAMEALQNLEDIIHRQQGLFDKTNKIADPAKAKEQADEQSGIRQQLGASLSKLGNAMNEIPENFAKADQSMKQSEQALGKGHPQDSLPYQKTVLDELQKGLDSAVSQAAQAMQQSIMSFGLQPNGGNYGEGFDPLGRGLNDNSDVKIPDEKERRRVQEIIQELRHRSNEPNRTKVERDYIERLLEQF
jgi:exonuclease VII large subunit